LNTDSRLDELFRRWQEIQDNGETISVVELCADCPDLREEFECRLRAMGVLERFLQQQSTASTRASPRRRSTLRFLEPSGRPPVTSYARTRSRGMGLFTKPGGETSRLVALKMILGCSAGPHHLARFRREAEALARLHPNIVRVYTAGQVDEIPHWY
jgi:serine/threonine protein kinase